VCETKHTHCRLALSLALALSSPLTPRQLIIAADQSRRDDVPFAALFGHRRFRDELMDEDVAAAAGAQLPDGWRSRDGVARVLRSAQRAPSRPRSPPVLCADSLAAVGEMLRMLSRALGEPVGAKQVLTQLGLPAANEPFCTEVGLAALVSALRRRRELRRAREGAER
jgi:hypothetical protein